MPGSILSASDLLDPAAIQAKKRVRAQPAGLRMRLQLPGTRAGDEPEVPREYTADLSVPEPLAALAAAAAAKVDRDAMEVDSEDEVAASLVASEQPKEKKQKRERTEEEKAKRKLKKESGKAKKEESQ